MGASKTPYSPCLCSPSHFFLLFPLASLSPPLPSPPLYPPLPSTLQLASRNGYTDAIRLLVDKGGADVQERNATTGWVALHEAAFRGHTECVKMLLQLNAPLRPRTPEEDTPKELAVRYKQKDIVDLLGEYFLLLYTDTLFHVA